MAGAGDRVFVLVSRPRSDTKKRLPAVAHTATRYCVSVNVPWYNYCSKTRPGTVKTSGTDPSVTGLGERRVGDGGIDGKRKDSRRRRGRFTFGRCRRSWKTRAWKNDRKPFTERRSIWDSRKYSELRTRRRMSTEGPVKRPRHTVRRLCWPIRVDGARRRALRTLRFGPDFGRTTDGDKRRPRRMLEFKSRTTGNADTVHCRRCRYCRTRYRRVPRVQGTLAAASRNHGVCGGSIAKRRGDRRRNET